MENIFAAWREFLSGKRNANDVIAFARYVPDNIIALREDLRLKRYRHGAYQSFFVRDPKVRHIHKASVRDRLLHHAVYRVLAPLFDRSFIFDSYSCRLGKGTHKAIDRLRTMARRVSYNHTRTCWILKADIRKCFASISQSVLLSILSYRVPDPDTLRLLANVLESFSSGTTGIGLPLGNLTSQLFINIYMNEFDQFVKHYLHEKYYIRYADDFVILSSDRPSLEQRIIPVVDFLRRSLHLALHPRKIELRTFASGVDFLGWVNFPDHRVLRTTTKQRMLRRIIASPTPEVFVSYLGLLHRGNTRQLQKQLRHAYWISHE